MAEIKASRGFALIKFRAKIASALIVASVANLFAFNPRAIAATNATLTPPSRVLKIKTRCFSCLIPASLAA